MGVILDSSVILKALLSPSRNLPEKVYNRERQTHEKCKYLMRLIEERNIEVHVPTVAKVEVAGVIKRVTGDADKALLAAITISENYNLHYDVELIEKALEISLSTGASGFDSYFIALANLLNLPLFTDDKGMHIKAMGMGIKSYLIRELTIDDIKGFFGD
ncbi:PIN domain-containing protein [Thermococcus barophilus]|uniref:Predicted nucleic acid-binding protein n=1 Tax=Thermococcus barophilus (strain DSM 11836 / MP) TaxID=391623 RepID=F0LK44_THEBM|nr:PIN domain-containing protein [Thermococcus barophilus]ADT84756.1 predicted nucleic acid-binding protein [Thermococcus barophilus MP]